ncbi:MAG: hypothetical protein M1269_10895 [Chloroflexi bacterium]|nr:hypothetical protein [Chloroflexota bacterium]
MEDQIPGSRQAEYLNDRKDSKPLPGGEKAGNSGIEGKRKSCFRVPGILYFIILIILVSLLIVFIFGYLAYRESKIKKLGFNQNMASPKIIYSADEAKVNGTIAKSQNERIKKKFGEGKFNYDKEDAPGADLLIEAEKELDRLPLTADSRYLYYLIGQEYQMRPGKYKEAVKVLKKALMPFKGSEDKLSIEVRIFIVITLGGNGQHDPALKELKIVESKFKDIDFIDSGEAAHFYYLRGEAYNATFQNKKAMEDFKKSIALAPYSWEGITAGIILSRIYYRFGEKDNAIKTLKQVNERIVKRYVVSSKQEKTDSFGKSNFYSSTLFGMVLDTFRWVVYPNTMYNFSEHDLKISHEHMQKLNAMLIKQDFDGSSKEIEWLLNFAKAKEK